MRGDRFSSFGWLIRRIRREVTRLSPEGRDAFSTAVSGGSAWIGKGGERLPAVLAALRALPDGAGAAAVADALDPLVASAPSDPEACWFCGRPRGEGLRMISGPAARVCEDCVRAAAAALAAPGATAAETGSKRCDFCGKWTGPDVWLIGGTQARSFDGAYAAICSECVTLCLEIFREEVRNPNEDASRVL